MPAAVRDPIGQQGTGVLQTWLRQLTRLQGLGDISIAVRNKKDRCSLKVLP